MEGILSPTAPFKSIKIFILDAARNDCRVHQLDFIGCFLQANVHFCKTFPDGSFVKYIAYVDGKLLFWKQ